MNRIFRLVPVLALALGTGLSSGAHAHGPNGHGNAAHGDHEPHHGGFVAMYQDLHFELVMPAEGGVKIYYTDAARAELPAAVVSEVAVEIERQGAKTETVSMSISAGGDVWEGRSRASPDPAIIRIAFMLNGKPALFSVSSANLPKAAKTASNNAHAGHHG